MRRGIRTGIALAAAAAGILLPANAAAGAGSNGDRPSFRSFQANVAIGDGLTARFYASGRVRSDRGYLGLDIAERRARTYSATSYYSSKRTLTGNRQVRGGLGSAGWANLKFTPTGPGVTRRGRCFESTTRPGVLVGSLRFRGEGGFVNLDESRLEGKRYSYIRRKCDPSKAGPTVDQEPVPTAQLTACGFPDGVDWQATRMPDGTTTFAGFGSFARSRGLYTSSYIYRKTRPGAFTFADDFSTATIAPPEPFLGTGEYANGAVTGDLRWVAPNGETNEMATVDALLARTDRRACAVFFRNLGDATTSDPARLSMRTARAHMGPALP